MLAARADGLAVAHELVRRAAQPSLQARTTTTTPPTPTWMRQRPYNQNRFLLPRARPVRGSAETDIPR